MLLAKKKTNKIIESKGDRVLTLITTLILLLLIFIVGYPVVYVVSSSFSSAVAIRSARVILFPVEFTLQGYRFVFDYDSFWIGLRNSAFYTVCGVSITMFLEIMAAYPLSKRNYQGGKGIMMIFFFTTLFAAGMIPTFIVKAVYLGMYGTVWAVLFASAIGVTDMIILRTAFRSIPGELFDAAAIDGANEFQTLVQIALPLVKATVSTLILYSAVGCWNEYFNAMIYLSNNETLQPLQLVLRNLLMAADVVDPSLVDTGMEQMRYALIVVSTVPVLVFYFVVQKYFKKGVMIGSVKG
ncbi:MAG: carbohydrate ABC transporter permease [Oscillospiraceae bacterium]|nr:carbohydrate ABC transporter permease [Oscillospiraceae bacterium]